MALSLQVEGLLVRENRLSPGSMVWRLSNAWFLGRAADGLVEEALGHHLRRVVQVAPVDHQRVGHRAPNAVQVQAAELRPRSQEHERVSPLSHVVGIRAQLDTWQDAP